MQVFGLELSPGILEGIMAHAERDYPREACGLVLGRREDPASFRLVPMQNVQDRYHLRSPVEFPRDGREAFRFDELERLRVLEEAQVKSETELAVYHSHCDAGAYFSPEDRAMAVYEGIELLPGAIHLVASVRRGRRADLAAFRYRAEQGTFAEQRLRGAVAEVPPDLEARGLEGRADSRPIRPVGAGLLPRRVTLDEQQALLSLSEHLQIRLDDSEALLDLERFARGFYSPLPGFLRAVEVRAIEQSGRLLGGTPWRRPVTLDIQAKRSVVLPVIDALIQLVDPEGRARAMLGLAELSRPAKDTVRLAGPVFVYAAPGEDATDAADVRAEWLRRGARRVLAVPPELNDRADRSDLGAFDAILGTRSFSGAPPTVLWRLPGADAWLNAAMAQNQGATHMWVEDPVQAKSIEESLQITPWRPGAALARRPPPELALESDAP